VVGKKDVEDDEEGVGVEVGVVKEGRASGTTARRHSSGGRCAVFTRQCDASKRSFGDSD
jgi:hypothetical protein